MCVCAYIAIIVEPCLQYTFSFFFFESLSSSTTAAIFECVPTQLHDTITAHIRLFWKSCVCIWDYMRSDELRLTGIRVAENAVVSWSKMSKKCWAHGKFKWSKQHETKNQTSIGRCRFYRECASNRNLARDNDFLLLQAPSQSNSKEKLLEEVKWWSLNVGRIISDWKLVQLIPVCVYPIWLDLVLHVFVKIAQKKHTNKLMFIVCAIIFMVDLACRFIRSS